MRGMLKAELFKLKNSYALWIIIGVITVSGGISIMMGTYSSAEQTLVNIAKDSMVSILACAVYSGIILTDDFSNGLLRHYIANGYKRSSIIFAKFIHYITGCSMLLFIYPCLCVLLSIIISGPQTTSVFVLEKTVLVFLKTVPLYWGVFALFFLFSILIPKGVITVGISIAFSILLEVFTNKLYGGGVPLLEYSPIIQITKAIDGPITNVYWISVVLSLAIVAGCIWISIVKFSHDEL